MLNLPLRLSVWPRKVPSGPASGQQSAVWRGFYSDTLFVLALIVVCGLSVFIGMATPLQSFAHDTFFLLDNAYRVVQGQVPSRDFSSAWGPIIFLIYAAGLVLSGMQPTGLGYANALFGAIIAIWAFLITRPRWNPVSACVVGLYTVLLITAPSALGTDPRNFSYAMVYNRFGYALFGIIVMECASVMMQRTASGPPDSWIRQSTHGAISTGCALALLIFLKISYGMVAAPFVACSLIVSSAPRARRFIGICAGFVTITVLVLCYLRFDITDILQDLSTAATARQRSLLVLHQIGPVDYAQIAAIFAFVGWRVAFRREVTRGIADQLGAPLFALSTVVAGYLLLISNQQSNAFPLSGYAAVALATDYWRNAPKRSPRSSEFGANFPAILLLVVCVLPLAAKDGASLAAAARERLWPNTPNVVSLTSTGRGAYFYFHQSSSRPTETTGARYAKAVDDGRELIRRHTASDGVLTLDEFNPFNYLLDRPSPRGGFAAAAYDYIFSDAAHPTPERFFGNTRYVMVRKYGPDIYYAETRDVLALMRIYGSVLQSDFSIVEQTEHWVLWKRRPL